jgi:hypothetical protein
MRGSAGLRHRSTMPVDSQPRPNARLKSPRDRRLKARVAVHVPEHVPVHVPEHVAAEAMESRVVYPCLGGVLKMALGSLPEARATQNKRLRAPRRPARRVWRIVGSSRDSEDRRGEASALPQVIGTCAGKLVRRRVSPRRRLAWASQVRPFRDATRAVPHWLWPVGGEARLCHFAVAPSSN